MINAVTKISTRCNVRHKESMSAWLGGIKTAPEGKEMKPRLKQTQTSLAGEMQGDDCSFSV